MIIKYAICKSQTRIIANRQINRHKFMTTEIDQTKIGEWGKSGDGSGSKPLECAKIDTKRKKEQTIEWMWEKRVQIVAIKWLIAGFVNNIQR